jgi:hypothetical protein
MKNKINFILFRPVFIMLCLIITACATLHEAPTQLMWENYPGVYGNPFKVCHNKRVLLDVNLPETIILNNDYVIFRISLNSGVLTLTDGLEQANFVFLTPYVSVNGGGLFGRIRIPVRQDKNHQVCPVKIKTKYLKSGPNTFEFSCGLAGGRRLSRGCYGYRVSWIGIDNLTNNISSSYISNQIKSPDTFIWPDYSKPLKVEKIRIDGSSPLTIRVNIPKSVIKKFRKIPLAIYSELLGNDASPYLTINDNKWHRYNFVIKNSGRGSVVKISTKRLKSGENILKFYAEPGPLRMYNIIELRFNLPNNISSN